MDEFDARMLNRRFVTPTEPAGALVLRVDAEPAGDAVAPDPSRAALDVALNSGPFPAVIVGDIDRWAAVAGMRTRAFIARVATLVESGGWLYLAHGNQRSPVASRPASLSMGSVRRALSRAGMRVASTYVTLPDHRTPAYLVPADGVAELGYVMRDLFVAHGAGSGARARLARVARRLFAILPHRVVVGFAPGEAVIAWRNA